MKATGKAALKLFEYLGASKNEARIAAKDTAKQLSTLLAGKSRKEKKEFVKALNVLTNDSKKEGNASQIILHTLTKNKYGADFDNGVKNWERLTMPIRANQATKALKEELPKTISKAMDDIFAEFKKPENINRIVDESIKEYRKEVFNNAKTMIYRVLSLPVNFIKSLSLSKAKFSEYKKLTELPKEQFRENFYNQLITKKGLANRAPKTPIVTTESAGIDVTTLVTGQKRVEGGFNGFTNTIDFTKEFNEASRATQANLISHELRHFEQADQIIRTFGIDRYIQAKKTYLYNIISQDPKYTKATPIQIQEEVSKLLKNSNITDDSIKEAFKNSINAKKINPNSAKGQRAKKYLEATENYQGLSRKGILTEISKEYLENALELEAYAMGKKTGKQLGIVENLNLKNI